MIDKKLEQEVKSFLNLCQEVNHSSIEEIKFGSAEQRNKNENL